MPKLVPFAAVITVAALGACTTPPQQAGPSAGSSNIVTNVHPYRPGSGVVQNVYPVPQSAAAGASSGMQRLEVKMSDGTVQYVDAPSGQFTKGTRIQLTEDKRISK